MTVHLSHPDDLLQQTDDAPVALATGSRLLLLAGRLAVTPAGEVTSTDLAGQVHSALHNVAIGVRGAGGGVSVIARLTFYVVAAWAPEMAGEPLDGNSRAHVSEGVGSRCHPSPSSASRRCGRPISSSRSKPPPS